MDNNEQNICKCATHEKTIQKPSKIIQTFSTATNDSDVFYDVPDENEPSIPKSSHRSRTSQNDRYRDHTNLSHEPNIEAPAGLRQQPAGQRQTYQAKDRDKNDGNYNGNNTNKDQSTLENYLTPRGACLYSNVSQDEFRNLSSETGNSIVKLSFSTNARVDLQGSYECFCGEEEENGSCHKFCCQRYEVLGNKKKKTIVEDSMRTFESQKKLIEREEDNETRTACCSQERIFDFKTKPNNYECLCVRKSLIVSSCIESCNSEEIESKELNNSFIADPILSEGEEITGTSSNFRNPIGQKNQPEGKSVMVQRSKDLHSNSERLNSNVTEDLCSCEHFENSTGLSTEHSGRLDLKEANIQEGNHSRRPDLNESFRSVGTGVTPRQTSMDENVIPLLKSIFDVLQTMREEKLHLGPIASKNIDIHLDEPFNGLPQPPPAPPSSPKFSKLLLSNSSDNQSSLFKSSRNILNFKEETDRDFINSEDSLAILDPPERDVVAFEQNHQETTPKLQRLIPVDMDLLRTDEELIWEPGSNFDKSEVEKEEDQFNSRDIEDIVPLKAQFRQFPEETLSELSGDEKVCRGSSCPRENTPVPYNTEKARLSSIKRSSSMKAVACEFICQEPENCADDQLVSPALHKIKLDEDDENEPKPMKITVSKAVQVNLLSLANLTSSSAQFLTIDNQLEDLSDEKLLKTSKINKSKVTLLPKVNSQSNTTTTKLDVGTDCPNFENDTSTLGSSIKSYHCYKEQPTKPPKNQEMSQFIESILFDLKAINSFRKNNSQWQSFAKLPCASTGGGWQRPSRALSYPVTIETVQELGANSLFIKWRVQNVGNIGGYEIFLDGHLTNRYFNCIHRAAVICDVDLQCPHRITLRAQPILQIRNALLPTTDSYSSSTSNTKCPSNASNTYPEATCPQPDGSVWYPSVYHFEPNSLSAAPINAVLY